MSQAATNPGTVGGLAKRRMLLPQRQQQQQARIDVFSSLVTFY
jgi:hypothetical protein